MKPGDEEKNMKKKTFHDEKMELVRIRIRNGFYNKSDVLETVVENLLKDGLKKGQTRDRSK
jgi:hypothetical protein